MSLLLRRRQRAVVVEPQTATTGGSSRRKKRVVQLAPVYSPTPHPEHWAAVAKRKRRNAALILALH